MSSSRTFDLYFANQTETHEPNCSLEHLAEYYGDDIFQRLLNSLLNTNFSKDAATNLWRAAIHHFTPEKTRTNWRSVILDYLLSHTNILSNPRIIEANDLKRMQEEAVTDGLTGLYNQTYLKNQLAEIILEKKQKEGASFSLILFDLDHFKQFNDRCGHLCGDRALDKIGKLICGQLPANAIAARYGGEEFAVILPDANLKQAIDLAEKIRLKIDQTEFEGEDRLDTGKLTISGGIASYPEAGVTSDTLISHADCRLYEAKAFRNSIFPRTDNMRRIQRHSYLNIVEIFNQDSGEFKHSLCSDINQIGILLKSSTPAIIGAQIQLRFPHPFWPNEHQAIGEVKHTRRSGPKGPFLVGIQFQQPEVTFLEEVLPGAQLSFSL